MIINLLWLVAVAACIWIGGALALYILSQIVSEIQSWFKKK